MVSAMKLSSWLAGKVSSWLDGTKEATEVFAGTCSAWLDEVPGLAEFARFADPEDSPMVVFQLSDGADGADEIFGSSDMS